MTSHLPPCLSVLRGFSGVLLGALLVLTGCDQPTGSLVRSDHAKHVHETRGEVREIAADRTTAVIRHEEIPGYMPRMTMELNVRDTNELRGITVGDLITFRLLATDETHWIDTVRPTGRAPTQGAAVAATGTAPVEIDPEEAAFSSPPPRELKPGDLMPDVTLQDEYGQPLRFADLRGRAVAFTFFFVRCPLPDFCPRMNRHFAETRRLLLADASVKPPPWLLLSVSFDPEFDKPAVLRGYARSYRGDDTNRWRFAVASTNTLMRIAPPLDLRMTWEAGSISHNLRTVVLDTRGRIHRQFDGNRWTARELADAVLEAARVPSAP